MKKTAFIGSKGQFVLYRPLMLVETCLYSEYAFNSV